MGASDNVVRGGLTVKHIDVEELLEVLDVSPLANPIVAGTRHRDRWTSFDTPDTPFRLWRRAIDGPTTHIATGREMLLCTEGRIGPIRQGETVFLLPDERIDLDGIGTVFRVEELSPDTGRRMVSHPLRRRGEQPVRGG